MAIFFSQNQKERLKIWEMPEKANAEYLICADVAEGLEGGNYSCAHVLKRHPLEQVAVWHGHENPYQFGRVLLYLGFFFNGCMIACERNNNGITTLDFLRRENYPNIYKMQKFDSEVMDDTDRVGWMTNMHTRPLIIDSLKYAVKTRSLILHDPETLGELKTFIRIQNKEIPERYKIKASPGSFDDRVISLAIGVYIHSTLPMSQPYMQTGSYMDKMRARWDEGKVLTPGRGGY